MSLTIDAMPAEAVTTEAAAGLSEHQIVGCVWDAQRALARVLDHLRPQKSALQQLFKALGDGDGRAVLAVQYIQEAGVNVVDLGSNMLVSCSNKEWQDLVVRHSKLDDRSPVLTASKLLREYLVAEIEAHLIGTAS